jgi:hypothetical protein
MNKLAWLLLGVGLWAGCSSGDRVQRSLEKAAAGGAASVTLADHTDFQWDTVYVYGPYADFNTINDKHGLNLKRDGKYEGDFVTEAECLYVFTLKGTAARPSFGPRRCDGILEPGVYSSKGAVFGIRRDGYGWDLTLRSNRPLERAGIIPPRPTEHASAGRSTPVRYPY